MLKGFGLKNTLFSIAAGMAFAYSMRLENENNLGVSPSVLNVGVGIIFLFALYKLYSEKSFPIFTKGLRGRTITIWVNKNTTITECRESICRRENAPAAERGGLKLIYAGRQLEEDRRIGDYGIEKHSTINAVLRLNGN